MAVIDIGNGFKITEDFITPNPYSRPQTKLTKVTKIAIHYVGNPKSTAKNNRDYFNNLAVTKATYVSSHFLVGLQGEIIQCIPTNEIAYCTNAANSYSISIETCHPDSTGKFNDVTEKALIQLVAYLLKQFNLKAPADIIRHYDVTGKQCPLYYVNNASAYANFKNQVTTTFNSLGTTKEEKLYYKINKTFNNGQWNADQKGAYDYPDDLDGAIKGFVDQKLGKEYFIFDPFGKAVYPTTTVVQECQKCVAYKKLIEDYDNQAVAFQSDLKKLKSENETFIGKIIDLEKTLQFTKDDRDSLKAILEQVHKITG